MNCPEDVAVAKHHDESNRHRHESCLPNMTEGCRLERKPDDHEAIQRDENDQPGRHVLTEEEKEHERLA